MPVKSYSVSAEQRYYGRKKYSMHAGYGRYQAGATGRNTMPAKNYPQRVLL